MMPLLTAIGIVALVPLAALYLQLVERKILADFQVRLGPMRTGPNGLFQPIADAIKLLLKEDIVPSEADRPLFWAAPILATLCALAAFTVVPFGRYIFVADVNVGILVISAAASVGILGIILGGWASNSHYPLLGALRSAAQLVSYEVALGFALLSGLTAAGTLSLGGIVRAQQERAIWFVFDNYGFMMVPFLIYLVAITAEANRAPFDLPEAESELIGGYHAEYSGLRWAFFMLAEYANMLVACAVGVTLFWGGWLRPFPSVAWLEVPLNYGVPVALLLAGAILCVKLEPARQRFVLFILAGIFVAAAIAFCIPAVNGALVGVFWFVLKIAVLIYLMIWFRGTFPRLRYDQLMAVSWKFLIPAGIVSLVMNAVLGLTLISR